MEPHRARRAITHGEADPVTALDELLDLLMPHTSTEENGLFVEVRAEGSLAEAVEKLCAEHDDIHGALGAVDRAAPDWPAVLAALERLHRHIDNEEYGLFPASIIALPIGAWDRVTPENPDHDHRHQREHDHDHPVSCCTGRSHECRAASLKPRRGRPLRADHDRRGSETRVRVAPCASGTIVIIKVIECESCCQRSPLTWHSTR